MVSVFGCVLLHSCTNAHSETLWLFCLVQKEITCFLSHYMLFKSWELLIDSRYVMCFCICSSCIFVLIITMYLDRCELQNVRAAVEGVLVSCLPMS